jgi:hypothetical protein
VHRDGANALFPGKRAANTIIAKTCFIVSYNTDSSKKFSQFYAVHLESGGWNVITIDLT